MGYHIPWLDCAGGCGVAWVVWVATSMFVDGERVGVGICVCEAVWGAKEVTWLRRVVLGSREGAVIVYGIVVSIWFDC